MDLKSFPEPAAHWESATYGDSVIFFGLLYYLTSAKTFSVQILELNQIPAQL